MCCLRRCYSVIIVVVLVAVSIVVAALFLVVLFGFVVPVAMMVIGDVDVEATAPYAVVEVDLFVVAAIVLDHYFVVDKSVPVVVVVDVVGHIAVLVVNVFVLTALVVASNVLFASVGF